MATLPTRRIDVWGYVIMIIIVIIIRRRRRGRRRRMIIIIMLRIRIIRMIKSLSKVSLSMDKHITDG